MTKDLNHTIFIPPVAIALLGLLGLAGYWFVPGLNVISWPWNLIAAAPFAIAGGWFFLDSCIRMKKYGTTLTYERSEKCVTDGSFAISRNPMLISYILLFAAFAVVLGNLIAMITPVIFFILCEKLFIPYEEDKMEREFGEEYLRYKKKVRRWF